MAIIGTATDISYRTGGGAEYVFEEQESKSYTRTFQVLSTITNEVELFVAQAPGIPRPYDPHPNPRTHEEWASRLAALLQPLLANSQAKAAPSGSGALRQGHDR